jgi:hypothetical protein
MLQTLDGSLEFEKEFTLMLLPDTQTPDPVMTDINLSQFEKALYASRGEIALGKIRDMSPKGRLVAGTALAAWSIAACGSSAQPNHFAKADPIVRAPGLSIDYSPGLIHQETREPLDQLVNKAALPTARPENSGGAGLVSDHTQENSRTASKENAHAPHNNETNEKTATDTYILQHGETIYSVTAQVIENGEAGNFLAEEESIEDSSGIGNLARENGRTVSEEAHDLPSGYKLEVPKTNNGQHNSKLKHKVVIYKPGSKADKMIEVQVPKGSCLSVIASEYDETLSQLIHDNPEYFSHENYVQAGAFLNMRRQDAVPAQRVMSGDNTIERRGTHKEKAKVAEHVELGNPLSKTPAFDKPNPVPTPASTSSHKSFHQELETSRAVHKAKRLAFKEHKKGKSDLDITSDIAKENFNHAKEHRHSAHKKHFDRIDIVYKGKRIKLDMERVDLKDFHPTPEAVNSFEKNSMPLMKKWIPLYMEAAMKEGVPQNWELLAALHGPELGYNDYFKANGAGPYGFSGGPSGPFQETMHELIPYLSDAQYSPVLKTLITPEGDTIPHDELNNDQFVILARLAYKHWIEPALDGYADRLKEGPIKFNPTPGPGDLMSHIMDIWNSGNITEGFNGFSAEYPYEPSESVWDGMATTYYLLKRAEANGSLNKLLASYGEPQHAHHIKHEHADRHEIRHHKQSRTALGLNQLHKSKQPVLLSHSDAVGLDPSRHLGYHHEKKVINKSQEVVNEAKRLAWSTATNSIEPTDNFAEALEHFDPSSPDDCGVGVSTVMRASGADKEYPPYDVVNQMAYVLAHPNKYKVVSYQVTDTAVLKPGDILLINGGTTYGADGKIAKIGQGAGPNGHTLIWLGDKGQNGNNVAEASEDTHSFQQEFFPDNEIVNDPLHRGHYLAVRLRNN